jgi:type IV pilus assembly protein PilC
VGHGSNEGILEYICKVGTPAGEVVEQSFNAPDEAALRSELEQKGFYLFSVRREGASLRLRKQKIPADMLLIFGQELAALLKAGLPLLQSLDIMLERQRHPVFHRSLETVRDKVKSGVALSEAFRAEGALYPPMLSASIVAGERSGNLEGVLRRFVQYVRLTQTLRKKAISAAVYPAVLLVTMAGLVSVLVVRVIPEFEKFYQGLDVQLPLATRALLVISLVVRDHVHWILLVIVGSVVGARLWLARPGSGVILDRFWLRVPFVGGLMRMYATSQLARTLAALLAGGLPLLNAIEVAAASLGNRAMALALGSASQEVREGKSLTNALESTHMLENLPLEMIKVGEQTGALGDMLNAISDFYDEELDNRMARIMALVEPVMVVLMAVIVAGMLLAFYLPLFQAIAAVQR